MSAVGLRIVNPPAGAIYLCDPTLRAEFQTLPLRALVERASGSLTWQVDGLAIGTSTPDGSLAWPLRAGEHRIAVLDAQGRRAEAAITVR
jgi:membrane carboxypeptidase/penicillin-binding protein PbpC